MISSVVIDLDIALAQLLCGALFFAMGSCEYSKVSQNESETLKTKPLQPRNTCFIKDNNEAHQRRRWSNADCVNITFKFQRNKTKWQSIRQSKSGDQLSALSKSGLRSNVKSSPTLVQKKTHWFTWT